MSTIPPTAPVAPRHGPTVKQPKPDLTDYVVETGLTRRLVRATDETQAHHLFLSSTPMLRNLRIGPGDVVVRRASDSDVASFRRRSNRALRAANLTFDL